MAPLGIGRALLNSSSGVPYEGESTGADLFWHLKRYETSSYSSAENVTFNIGGTNRDSRITVYDGNQTFGSGSIAAASNRLTMARIQGNLTISSGFTLSPSADSLGLFLFIDGDLTVNGTISTYQLGQSLSSAPGALMLNSSENETAGSTEIQWNGSAGSHTNGSSTANAMTAGGGGQGGYGSYGRGNGAVGHTFAGGSGGGGGGGIAYYNHYSGGGGGGGGATTLSRNGGNGGASGHTKWGYWTSDKGGMGGNGNPAGSGGANNSYNPSSSSAGGSGHSSSVSASLGIYATGNLTIASGGTIQTLGRGGVSGGTSQMSSGGGGGTGGGILVAVCGGTFTNNGTVSSAGGATGSGRGSGSSAGSGGVLTGGGYA
mgnify:CR=1 FL=1